MTRRGGWMLAIGGFGTALWPAGPLLADEAPSPDRRAEDPDLAALRRQLRRAGDLPLAEEVPGILSRLARRDQARAPAWALLKAFAERTRDENRLREPERLLTRVMRAPGQQEPSTMREWQVRIHALMALVREGRLAGDVYQEARRALEVSLRQALETVQAEGKRPDPAAADEAVRLLLERLEPELRDPRDLPPALRGKVVRLVAALGDPEWKVREAASRELLSVGEPALGALRESLDSKDAEVAERARAAWERILDGAGSARP